MLALEARHIFGVAFVPSVTGDIGLLALDLPHMSHGMAVARGARLLQREIDQAPAQQNRGNGCLSSNAEAAGSSNS